MANSPCPYRALMRYRRWATNELNRCIAAHWDRIGEEDRQNLLRLLDHIQVVDEIFRHHLEGRPHDHAAPRSATLPGFAALAEAAAATADWYVAHVEGLAPEAREERVGFTFSSGEAACMTRGEMLLHVALHGTYHRGNAGVLLLRNGITPPPDRMTDFLASEEASPGHPAALAEAMA